MTYDTEDLNTELTDTDAPALCLVHYFTERDHGPPPAAKSLGRVAARDGNLIVLEFAAPPKPALGRRPGQRKPSAIFADAVMLLLLLLCAAGCVLAFRF